MRGVEGVFIQLGAEARLEVGAEISALGKALVDLDDFVVGIFATASGMSASSSNLLKKVSSFIQQSRRWR
jgi:hypothetical protein